MMQPFDTVTLLACGGCTDAVLLSVHPWSGFGILFLWAWIAAASVRRKYVRRHGLDQAFPYARRGTLICFAILGSIGYVVFWFLTMGSLFLPSLFLGFLWVVYLSVRLCVDLVRFLWSRRPELRTTLAIHAAFLSAVAATVALGEWRARSLDGRIFSLRYHHGTEVCSVTMPAIVARGDRAVKPLSDATMQWLSNHDWYCRQNMLIGTTFCLSQIGGSEAEGFLGRLVREHTDSEDWYDRRWHHSACFAYAHCAGHRATADLIAFFKKLPDKADRDERWCPLVALTMTAGKEAVGFVLDHMDLLLEKMDNGNDGNEARIARSTAERLVFGSDPEALKTIPCYRTVYLEGRMDVAEPRANSYLSDFYWTRKSESQLRPAAEIAAAWKAHSTDIRKCWLGQLK
ncbi:MAG: hypothetical protein LLF97_01240 [Planctomycetaceae bacterium]|nr:hypothetical protein [Planctomycetaceae bacterium]